MLKHFNYPSDQSIYIKNGDILPTHVISQQKRKSEMEYTKNLLSCQTALFKPKKSDRLKTADKRPWQTIATASKQKNKTRQPVLLRKTIIGQKASNISNCL